MKEDDFPPTYSDAINKLNLNQANNNISTISDVYYSTESNDRVLFTIPNNRIEPEEANYTYPWTNTSFTSNDNQIIHRPVNIVTQNNTIRANSNDIYNIFVIYKNVVFYFLNNFLFKDSYGCCGCLIFMFVISLVVIVCVIIILSST